MIRVSHHEILSYSPCRNWRGTVAKEEIPTLLLSHLSLPLFSTPFLKEESDTQKVKYAPGTQGWVEGHAYMASHHAPFCEAVGIRQAAGPPRRLCLLKASWWATLIHPHPALLVKLPAAFQPKKAFRCWLGIHGWGHRSRSWLHSFIQHVFMKSVSLSLTEQISS